jgi:hypothetical protein
VLEENMWIGWREEIMWIGWRAEQVVMKQEVHTELWMEGLMKTAFRKDG